MLKKCFMFVLAAFLVFGIAYTFSESMYKGELEQYKNLILEKANDKFSEETILEYVNTRAEEIFRNEMRYHRGPSQKALSETIRNRAVDEAIQEAIWHFEAKLSDDKELAEHRHTKNTYRELSSITETLFRLSATVLAALVFVYVCLFIKNLFLKHRSKVNTVEQRLGIVSIVASVIVLAWYVLTDEGSMYIDDDLVVASIALFVNGIFLLFKLYSRLLGWILHGNRK